MKNVDSRQKGRTDTIAQELRAKSHSTRDKEQVNAQNNKFGFASRFGQFLAQSQGTVNRCKGPI